MVDGPVVMSEWEYAILSDLELPALPYIANLA